jgi:hypothetical protein
MPEPTTPSPGRCAADLSPPGRGDFSAVTARRSAVVGSASPGLRTAGWPVPTSPRRGEVEFRAQRGIRVRGACRFFSHSFAVLDSESKRGLRAPCAVSSSPDRQGDPEMTRPPTTTSMTAFATIFHIVIVSIAKVALLQRTAGTRSIRKCVRGLRLSSNAWFRGKIDPATNRQSIGCPAASQRCHGRCAIPATCKYDLI